MYKHSKRLCVKSQGVKPAQLGESVSFQVYFLVKKTDN